MKTDYTKYRAFLRRNREFLEKADPDTVYEVTGQNGVTVGYFSINNPLE
jgi:hypothetical protein